MGVSPFGNPRIEAYLQLPVAYRSLSRPSSAPDAKAFTLCSSSLELSIDSFESCCSLELLEFHKQIIFGIHIAVKGFILSLALNHSTMSVKLYFTLIWKDQILRSANLVNFVLFNLFVSTLQYALFGFQ